MKRENSINDVFNSGVYAPYKFEIYENSKHDSGEVVLNIGINNYEESEYARRLAANENEFKKFKAENQALVHKYLPETFKHEKKVEVKLSLRDLEGDLEKFVCENFEEGYSQLRKKSFLFANHSARFIPHWDPFNPRQLVGLIELMNHIRDIDRAPKKMLEIGSYLGESATIFLSFNNIKKLYCVDTCDYYGVAVSPETINKIYKERLELFIQEGRCSFHKESSFDFLERTQPDYFDIIYVDGGHLEEEVSKDLAGSWKCLKSGGFLCGHDYYLGNIKNVVQNFASTAGMEKDDIKEFRDGSWCFRKP